MATREQIAAALVNAHEAGDVEAARKLAQAYQSFDAPEKEEKGTVFDSMGSGLTAGLSDEIAGAVGAIPAAIHTGDWNLGNHYRGIRDQARENQNAFAERNPGTAFAAEMAGGLLTGGAGLARVGVRQAVNTLPRLAGAGAGVGAVAGFGHSEAEGLGGMAQDTAVGAGTGAVGGVLLPPVASAIGRGVTAPFRHAQATRAARPTAKVGQAIARDDLTTDKIAAKLKKLPAGASIADAGGESLQTLARDITVQPGKARNIGRALFEGRRKLAPQRIDSAVRSALDTRGKFHEAKGMLARRMKEDAKPFYEEAYSRPLRMTPELKAVLERPAMRDAVQAGMKMARNEGGVIQGHVQTLDYAKRALDDQIGTAIRKGDNQLARALQGTKRALVSEMDRQVPAYRKAREAFAGPAALDDALDSGRKFMREDAEDLADAIENMTPSEKEFFRMGAIREIRDRVLAKSDTADAYKAIFSSPLLREKVRALFPDNKSFAKFQRSMQGEARMFETGTKVMGGSQTSNKQQGIEDLTLDPGTVVDAITSPRMAAVNALKTWLRRHAPEIRNEKMRDEIAEMLFSTDKATQQKVLRQINAPVRVKSLDDIPLKIGGAVAGGQAVPILRD